MYLNEDQTLTFYVMMIDCIVEYEHDLKLEDQIEMPEDLRKTTKDKLQLAKELKKFLGPINELVLEEVPF